MLHGNKKTRDNNLKPKIFVLKHGGRVNGQCVRFVHSAACNFSWFYGSDFFLFEYSCWRWLMYFNELHFQLWWVPLYIYIQQGTLGHFKSNLFKWPPWLLLSTRIFCIFHEIMTKLSNSTSQTDKGDSSLFSNKELNY